MKDREEYINRLKVLEFQEEKPDCSSIYFVDKQAEYITQEVSPYIIVALDKAKELKVDAVYFRFFDDGRLPEQICFQ